LSSDGEKLVALDSMDLFQTVSVNRERHVEFVLHSKDLKAPLEQ
jgi:hypothetical protein